MLANNFSTSIRNKFPNHVRTWTNIQTIRNNLLKQLWQLAHVVYQAQPYSAHSSSSYALHVPNSCCGSFLCLYVCLLWRALLNKQEATNSATVSGSGVCAYEWLCVCRVCFLQLWRHTDLFALCCSNGKARPREQHMLRTTLNLRHL